MLLEKKSLTLIAVLSAAICMATGVLYGIVKQLHAEPIVESTSRPKAVQPSTAE